MRLRFQQISRGIAVAVMIALVLCGCGKPEEIPPSQRASASMVETAAQKAAVTIPEPPVRRSYDTISVAVYPYIPDIPKFQALLDAYWADFAPDVKLEYVDWDGYGTASPEGIDVIMYDALFATNLVENGYIQPIEYSDIENGNEKRILPFAMEGAVHDGKLYGIPFFACSYFLIHRADDAELAEVDNFPELFAVLAERKAEDESVGLQTDFIVNTSFYYLDALMDFSGEYSFYDELPDTDTLDENVEELFVQMKSLLAEEPELEEDNYWNLYSAAFNLGYGSAFYGYSEDMFDMVDIIDDLTIRSISFSDKENIPMFFTDIASIGSHVTDPQKLVDCKKILNIIASKDFQLALCMSEEHPQYILPARQSVYAELKKHYPMYDNLHRLVVNDASRVSRFGTDVYTYFEDAYDNLMF